MLLLDMTQYKAVKGKRLGSVLVMQFSRAQPGRGLGLDSDVSCVRCIRYGVSSHLLLKQSSEGIIVCYWSHELECWIAVSNPASSREDLSEYEAPTNGPSALESVEHQKFRTISH